MCHNMGRNNTCSSCLEIKRKIPKQDFYGLGRKSHFIFSYYFRRSGYILLVWQYIQYTAKVWLKVITPQAVGGDAKLLRVASVKWAWCGLGIAINQ
ncbi:hypothetical protein SRDD_38420 [Serratia sp. DD3]|nr:hypothetical protein SRDD_38420 [Serratia sp. DD3]